MANYEQTVRSNKFKIKSDKKEDLKKILDNLSGEDIYTNIIEKEDGIYGWIGCYGSLTGLNVENYYLDNKDLINKYKDDEHNAMIDELQKIVDKDSAIIIIDAGHEKLRFVGGGSLVITNKDAVYIDIEDIAIKTAKQMLIKDNKDN